MTGVQKPNQLEMKQIEKILKRLKQGKVYRGQWRSVTRTLTFVGNRFIHEQTEPCRSYACDEFRHEYTEEELVNKVQAMTHEEFLRWAADPN